DGLPQTFVELDAEQGSGEKLHTGSTTPLKEECLKSARIKPEVFLIKGEGVALVKANHRMLEAPLDRRIEGSVAEILAEGSVRAVPPLAQMRCHESRPEAESGEFGCQMHPSRP